MCNGLILKNLYMEYKNRTGRMPVPLQERYVRHSCLTLLEQTRMSVLPKSNVNRQEMCSTWNKYYDQEINTDFDRAGSD